MDAAVDRSVLRVALTGGIATGKSYCLARFAKHGAAVVDADDLAHDALRPGSPGFSAAVARFGDSIRAPDDRLDRAALGRIVFGDPAALRDLEHIVHPIVYSKIAEWSRDVAEAASKGGDPVIAIAEVALLYETGHESDFDVVVVAVCDAAEQERRIIARDGLPAIEARQRLASQRPISEKAARADLIIRTDTTRPETDSRIDVVWNHLVELGRRRARQPSDGNGSRRR